MGGPRRHQHYSGHPQLDDGQKSRPSPRRSLPRLAGTMRIASSTRDETTGASAWRIRTRQFDSRLGFEVDLTPGIMFNATNRHQLSTGTEFHLDWLVAEHSQTASPSASAVTFTNRYRMSSAMTGIFAFRPAEVDASGRSRGLSFPSDTGQARTPEALLPRLMRRVEHLAGPRLSQPNPRRPASPESGLRHLIRHALKDRRRG